MSVRDRLAGDIAEVLETARDDIAAFRGARLFVTGGTGFVGTWFLRALVEANRAFGLGMRVDVLTRDAAAFARVKPEIALAPGVTLVAGDVAQPFPIDGTYDGIVHAATPASAELSERSPETMLDIIVNGGRRIVELTERSGAIPLLFTSSGAVYGALPAALDGVEESYGGGPDVTNSKAAYGEGKRVAELQLCLLARRSGARVAIARLFAFVGPYLPLDTHFAIGNFIRDGLAGGPVVVRGDGTPRRSYLYASDMTAWLWAVFARGRSCRPYNLGSSQARDIAAVAHAVAEAFDATMPVHMMKVAVPGAPAERYVPATHRIEEELGVRRRVELPEGIRRTIAWHRGEGPV